MLATRALLVLALALQSPTARTPTVVRIGHLSNVTHAQALVARGLAREGRPGFERWLGPDASVTWTDFNAGPKAVEALASGELDLAYVGPNPALEAANRSDAESVRIVAGACSGGAALVVRDDGRIRADSDFRGKKVATPQRGNTQDVAARWWLLSKGFRLADEGGDVEVVSVPNSRQLTLFLHGDLDAVWTVEPWVSRLEVEGRGKVYFEERALWPETGGRYATTVLVAREGFLRARPDLVKRCILAHLGLTDWIREHPAEAKAVVNRELKVETLKILPLELLDRSWKRLELTHDPIRASLERFAERAHEIGLLATKPNVATLCDLTILNEQLAERGAAAVR